MFEVLVHDDILEPDLDITTAMTKKERKEKKERKKERKKNKNIPAFCTVRR